MRVLIALALILGGFEVIKAETDISEEELNITPELTRELLLSALKLLDKERAAHVVPPKPVKVLKMYQPTQPCSNIMYSAREKDDVKADEGELSQDTTNARRSIIIPKQAIARDPYTGLNKIVTVPVIYPTYRIISYTR